MALDKRIVALAMGGLAIGTTEFAIMGLLPDVANDMHISIAEAGHFISAYALGVVIGAPLIVYNANKFAPKQVLIWLMIIFGLFNGLSAISPNYEIMLLLRFLSGLPHGAYFGVATVVATKLAEEGQKGKFIAMTFAGLTIANLSMVPLMTYLGHILYWGVAFLTVSAISILTVLLLKLWLPNIPKEEKPETLKFLTRSKTWYVLIITSIGFGGFFAWLSYINPLLTNVAGFTETQIPSIMILAGAGMVSGNLISGYATDKLGSGRALILFLTLVAVTLICIFFLSASPMLALILTFLCGTVAMTFITPINILILNAASDAEMMSAAFIQSGFNVANALGAYLGGLPLVFGLSYAYPALVGAGLSIIGLIISMTYILKYKLMNLK